MINHKKMLLRMTKSNPLARAQTIGQQIAHEFFSRAPQYRSKIYLARDIDAVIKDTDTMVLKLIDALKSVHNWPIQSAYSDRTGETNYNTKGQNLVAKVLKEYEEGKL